MMIPGPQLGARRESLEDESGSWDPVIQGSMDPQAVQKVFRGNRGELRSCADSQPSRQWGGKLVVRFVIAPTGKVVRVMVTESKTGNAELDACVTGVIRKWRFPQPRGGGVALVTWPLLIKPGP